VGLLRRLSAAAPLLLLAGPARAGTLRVRADARVDLAGLVQQLSGDDAFPRRAPLDRALARFAPWRRHPAVRRLAAMAARGFRGDLPSNYALYLATGPLREAYPVPSLFVEAAGGRAELDAWRGELEDFARQSGFFAWEASAESPAAALEASLRAQAGRADLEGPLLAYLGARSWESWTLTPSVFFPPGGGASWILEEKAGLPDVFVVFGPDWTRPREPFGSPEELSRDAWAEAVFSTAYRMYDACRPKARPAREVCAATPRYTEPESCVQRQWVNAVLERLAARAGRPAPRDRSFQVDARWRAPLRRALAAYEADRAAHPDLLSYAGPLLAPFQADGRAPACGPVNSIIER
jgi:hypothetical protein